MANRTKLMGIIVSVLSCSLCPAAKQEVKPVMDVHDGWQLGVQAWSFKDFSFYDAVDKASALGLGWIEAFPGQKLRDDPNQKFGEEMGIETRSAVKRKLADAHVRLASYGVIDMPNDEARCRRIFEFARDMGITTLEAEPEQQNLELIDKLCQEYKISLGLHNHPRPSRYWNPETVLQACRGRSNRIGACADTGHWMRSGINPVEAIRKLKGRIISVHLKDLNEFGDPNAHDVPWGTGAGNVESILKQLDSQGFKGEILIEYEYNMKLSLPEIKKCVAWYNATAAKLKPTEQQ